MTELDKFKRRLVRSVSKLLQQGVDEQNKAWEMMRKETGCDCKLLWQRMRALTIKKLKRLLAADDRLENIAAIARLSATDWLLYNLVLVHEKMDVIGRDQIGKGKGKMQERPVLEELFELVQEFKIEQTKGERLLEAWVALTQFYNSRGRHVSPMLLQKRWYQLKEMTRTNFYKLWNSYRGNPKLWEVAKASKPTPLQSEIAKKFPQIITQRFPEWDELVQSGRIILPEQFEALHRKKNRPKTVDDKPDIVVIEPVIETIELADESDEDKTATNDDNAQTYDDDKVNLALVKQEPIEDGLSNVQILETSHVPAEFNEDTNSNSHFSSSSANEANRENLKEQMSSFIQDAEVDDTSASIDQTVTEDNVPDMTEEVEDETAEVAGVEEPETEAADDTIEIPDELIKQKAEEYIKGQTKTITKVKPEPDVKESAAVDKDDEEVEDIIKQKADDFVRQVEVKKLVDDVVDEFKLPAELDFADGGMEFVDDGIEYVEEDESGVKEEIKQEPADPEIKTEVEEDEEVKNEEVETEAEEGKIRELETKQEGASSPKFDLKLLMQPVVYTTKIDDMIVFKGKKIDFVKFQNIIDSVIIESKPVSKLAIKIEEKDVDDIPLSKFNLTQSIKAIEDDLFKNNPNLHDSDTNDSTNDPSNRKEQTLQNNSDSDDPTYQPSDDNLSDDEIDDSLKVKANSYLLQKPRNRSYNPINLCKNPDFNTRLKRLTAGFFSSARNRQLFSSCKPLTIDVHKAFEPKLVNGKLYIKSSGENAEQIKEIEKEEESSSVMPSAMPIQSLLSKDNTVNIADLISSPQVNTVDLTQRSKTINLRDLSEIRRINQNLLTAQVPPMRLENIDDDDTIHSGQQVEIDDAENDASEVMDDLEEPTITDISGGQDLSLKHSAPVPDLNVEEPTVDNIPRSYQDLIFDSFSRGRGRGRGGGRGNGRGRGTGVKKPVSLPPYKVKFPVNRWQSWQLKAPPKPAMIDEFLITIDTLNRMINKLDGMQDYKNPKKNKQLTNNLLKTSGNLESKNVNDDAPIAMQAESTDVTADITTASTISTDATTLTDSTLVITDTNAVTDTNSPTDIPEAIIDVAVETTVDNQKKQSNEAKKKKRKPSRKYCCWARERIEKNFKSRLGPHNCARICLCCCRQALAAISRQKRELENVSNEDSIVLSDGDDAASLMDTDSNDARIPGFDPEPPTPIVRVYSTNKTHQSKTNTSCLHTNSTCTSACAGRETRMSSAGVSSTQVVTVPTVTAPVEPQPVLRINVSFTPAPTEVPAISPVIPTISTGTALTETLQHIATQVRPVPAAGAPLLGNKVTTPPSIAPILTAPTPFAPRLSDTVKLLPRSLNKVNIPVTVQPKDRNQRRIVIDASGPTTSIATERDDRVVFLNSKILSKKPKESPIFLGKNKILLTTVKFPLNIGGENQVTNPPIPPSKVIPPLSLPSGVQLVLMPDGQLSYTVDPSVQLDEAQIAVLPSIVTAVQEQISISKQQMDINVATSFIFPSTSEDGSNKITEPHIVETSGQENVTVISESVYAEKDAHQQNKINTSKNSDKMNDASKGQNMAERNITKTSDENTESSKEQNTSKETETMSEILESDSVENVKEAHNTYQQNKMNTAEGVDKNNDASKEQNTAKTLSDSPDTAKNTHSSNDSTVITIDDIDDPANTVTPTATTSVANNSETSEGASSSRNLLSDLMEMSGISADDARPHEATNTLNLPAHTTLENPVMQVVSTTGPVPASTVSNAQNLPELSPITSLTELKYACDNNGSFFKLDLDTGVIAPINVCIKRNSKVNKPRILRPVLAPKSVIDLTDDVEVETPSNVTKDGLVKPIKLFKRTTDETPSVLNKRTRLLRVLNTEHQLKLAKCAHKNRRKQSLEKIEAKIDLVDSDAPMEEEYLVDSSGSDLEANIPVNTINRTYERRKNPVIYTDTEDSSDEEPLAKKSMRLRQADTNQSEDIDDNSDNNGKRDADNNNESQVTSEPQESLHAPDDLQQEAGLPTPVGLTIPGGLTVPVGVPTPVGLPKPIILSTPADSLTPDGVLTPVALPTPVSTLTPVGHPIPVGALTPIGLSTPIGTLTPVALPTPVSTLTPVDSPTVVGKRTPVPIPVATIPSLPLAPAVSLEGGNADDNLNSEEMDVEEPHYISFMSEANESQEEDCILGV